MIDQNSQFLAILTAVGSAKQANADALGIPWLITHMGVGDANGTDPIPDRLQTALIHERRRAPLNQLTTDKKNPGLLIAEQVIPADVGGWWVREVGLYDADGDLVAVSNCAPSYKPLLAQGSGRTQVVRMTFIISSTANVVLKIDPSVVLATISYVDQKVQDELKTLDAKQSVLVASTVPIKLHGLQKVDGKSLTAGARVLVKNQVSEIENGIYLASAGPWSRSADADTNARVTPNLSVCAEEGLTQANTRWQLVTNGPITVGKTALNFQNIHGGLAPLMSPVFVAQPQAPTAAQFQNNQQLATTQFVQRALGNFREVVSYNSSAQLTEQDIGKFVIGKKQDMVLTLPDAIRCPSGACIHIQSSPSVKAITVKAKTGQLLGRFSGKSQDALHLRSPTSIGFISDGTQWHEANATCSASFDKNGYIRHPGGLIEQWVEGLCDDSGTLRLSLPIQFPGKIIGGLANEGHPNGWLASSATIWAFNLTQSSSAVVVANARVVNGTDGPKSLPGVTGRIRVWGY